MATGSGQIVVKSLVDGVPDLYAAHLLFEIISMYASIIMALILDLGSDWSDCKAASDWPLDGIALTFRKLNIFAEFAEANLATDRLNYWDILEVLSAFLIKIRDGICLNTAILLVNGDYEAAIIAHTKVLKSRLLLRLRRRDVESPNFHWAICASSHQGITRWWKLGKLHASILTYFELAKVLVAILLVSARYFCEIEFPGEDLTSTRACNDDAGWAAGYGVELFVTRAWAIVIWCQLDFKDEYIVIWAFWIYPFTILCSCLRWLICSGSTATPAHTHLIVVCLQSLATGRVAAVLGTTTATVYHAAQRAEVIQVHCTIVRARQ